MTDDHNEDKVDELFEETTGTRRTDVASASSNDETAAPDVVDAIAAAYAELDRGDRDTAISTRDDRLAAVLGGLEEVDRIEPTARAVWDELEDDPESAMHTKSALVAGLLRVGLNTALPDLTDRDDEAFNQFLREHMSR